VCLLGSFLPPAAVLRAAAAEFCVSVLCRRTWPFDDVINGSSRITFTFGGGRIGSLYDCVILNHCHVTFHDVIR